MMEFRGSANVIDDGYTPPYGIEMIGGTWDGDISVVIDGPLSGVWKATRQVYYVLELRIILY